MNECFQICSSAFLQLTYLDIAILFIVLLFGFLLGGMTIGFLTTNRPKFLYFGRTTPVKEKIPQ